MKDKQHDHRAVDTDNENSTLKRYHPEAMFADLNDPRGLDSLFATLEDAPLVVVDGRAASTDLVLDYFAEVSAFELLDGMDTRLTVVMPVNHEADSVTQIKLISDILADRCRYVVVKNRAHSEQFTLYERSKTRARLVDELNAGELVMPRMYDWLVAALNQHSLTATQAQGHPAFTVVDRQRLKNWQKTFYAQVDAHAEALLSELQPALHHE